MHWRPPRRRGCAIVITTALPDASVPLTIRLGTAKYPGGTANIPLAKRVRPVPDHGHRHRARPDPGRAGCRHGRVAGPVVRQRRQRRGGPRRRAVRVAYGRTRARACAARPASHHSARRHHRDERRQVDARDHITIVGPRRRPRLERRTWAIAPTRAQSPRAGVLAATRRRTTPPRLFPRSRASAARSPR